MLCSRLTAGGWTLIRERLGSRIVPTLLRGIGAVYQSRPVPLRVLAAVSRASGGDHETLSRMWAETVAGPSQGTGDQWGMHPTAVTFLSSQIRRIVPSYVLEFGSGSSTVWIAALMKELHGTDTTRLFSIEQDGSTASSVRRDLDRHGLDEIARIVVAPLAPREIWGKEVTTYRISQDEIDELTGGTRPELVVIDGPAGDPGARFGTLPLVLDHLAPGALFFLDDALRRGELEVGADWARSAQIRVAGVHLIGRGLLAGSVGSST